MTTTRMIIRDLAAISGKGRAANGNRILRMTDAAEIYYWNGSAGRLATEEEAREAGF